MIRLTVVAFGAYLALVLGGCRPSVSGNRTSASTPLPAADEPVLPLPDACGLLTPAELEGVLGEKLQGTTTTGDALGTMAVANCSFNMATPASSVSLALFGKREGGRNPRDFWKEMFHREVEADDHDNEEKGEKKSHPEAIAGLGDECFWTGLRVGGTLYVLKGNRYLCVSVGSARGSAARLEISRHLAELILPRL